MYWNNFLELLTSEVKLLVQTLTTIHNYCAGYIKCSLKRCVQYVTLIVFLANESENVTLIWSVIVT